LSKFALLLKIYVFCFQALCAGPGIVPVLISDPDNSTLKSIRKKFDVITGAAPMDSRHPDWFTARAFGACMKENAFVQFSKRYVFLKLEASLG
jgi:hypothetical protein